MVVDCLEEQKDKTMVNAVRRKSMAKIVWALIVWILIPLYSSRCLSAVQRECRSVWVATIGGLDWPKVKANSPAMVDAQKRELCQLLDAVQQAGFNTIFFQTRIRSTVIYRSAFEPWDDCLTGHAGKDPGYDPLAFVVDECHRRKLQLHAWVVAFPGHKVSASVRLGSCAMDKRLPALCMKTGDTWMLNPGVPSTADYLAGICQEIVRGYDVDGIHLDYVRYPEHSIPFNDAKTYRQYGKGLSKETWRRDNVTRCVRSVYQGVKSIKPWVWVSCSPVGKYCDLPRQDSRGWNAYDAVYQDAQKWLSQGIMDMLVPMMYFRLDSHFYPFALDWKESSCDRPIVIGTAAYQLDPKEADWPLATIRKQLGFSRTIGAGGQAFFRCRYVLENVKSLYGFLKDDFYSTPSMPLAMTWMGVPLPAPPCHVRLEKDVDGFLLKWEASASRYPIAGYNLYICFPKKDGSISLGCPWEVLRQENFYRIPWQIPQELFPAVAITTVDRFGQESKPAWFCTEELGH